MCLRLTIRPVWECTAVPILAILKRLLWIGNPTCIFGVYVGPCNSIQTVDGVETANLVTVVNVDGRWDGVLTFVEVSLILTHIHLVVLLFLDYSLQSSSEVIWFGFLIKNTSLGWDRTRYFLSHLVDGACRIGRQSQLTLDTLVEVEVDLAIGKQFYLLPGPQRLPRCTILVGYVMSLLCHYTMSLLHLW